MSYEDRIEGTADVLGGLFFVLVFVGLAVLAAM